MAATRFVCVGNTKRVVHQNGGCDQLGIVRASEAGGLEAWDDVIVHPLDASHVAFESASGRFWSAQPWGGLQANRLRVGDSRGPGYLQTVPIVPTTMPLTAYEAFEQVGGSVGGSVAFRSVHGTYVSVRPDQGGHLVMSNTLDQWSSFTSGTGRAQPIDRPPLPAPPPGEYYTEMAWTPPDPFTDRNFLRANCWSVTIPGLPKVAGTDDVYYERMLSWFYDRYPQYWRDRVMDAHAQRGYTHFQRSAADSINGNGLSLNQFVSSCLENKAAGFYVIVFLGSKVYQPAYMSVADWANYADPIMDALTAAGAVDEFVLGWEWDLWNTPGDISINANKHMGQKAHAAGCTAWHHFSTERTSWFRDQEPRGRFGYWHDLGVDIDGLMYQTDPSWGMRDLQDRLVDTLWQFGVDERDLGLFHVLRCFEDAASLGFSNPQPDEDHADQRGYYACCARDDVRHLTNTCSRLWGYGNGGRRPDGSPL